ncbi:MAG: DUF4160 domain-containing protein [Bacteroidota bacterium]|nr:DUF4160 domain-containing protein [Bacteroidota bacterium]
MPQLSRFYGIIIYLYFKDHHPPHFHAWYSENKCEISIPDLKIIAGSLPRRAQALVLEWAALHKEELLDNWALAKEGKPFNTIEPLP